MHVYVYVRMLYVCIYVCVMIVIISYLSKVLPSILEFFNPLILMRNEYGQASFWFKLLILTDQGCTGQATFDFHDENMWQ